MNPEVGFSEIADVETPDIQDDETEKLKQSVHDSVRKGQMKKEIESDMGINAPPSTAESVPPELPKMIFSAGSKIIGCDKFNLDGDEPAIMAKHISNIIGAQDSKIYSLFIIIVMFISKVGACWGKAKRLFKGKNLDDQEFDDKTESTQKVYG